jgi:superfamily II DNA/RNA helicase
MLKKKATNMLRATIVILDEADKMFDMGFGMHMLSASCIDST